MNQNTRIQGSDNVMTATMKLAESNPGAMTALMSLMQDAERVDPQAMMGGLGVLLSFDSYGIYGTDIYVLWSDICNKDNVKTIAVLRAVQLGFFQQSVLQDACSRQDFSGRDMVPVDELYEKVYERLEQFNRVEEEA